MEQKPQKPKASVKAKLLLLGISLGFSLLFAEILMRIFIPYNLGSTGHWAAPNADKYGWGFNPGAKVRILDPDTGDLHVYKMNRQGWQDRDHEFLKPKDVFRVLIIGDSVTFGAIVPPETIYPRVLEKEMQKEGYNVEVISMGYGGWGTDQQLEALKLEGIRYQPDLFINQFTANDLSDNQFYKQGSNRRKKPFAYHLEDGEAVRRKDKDFQKVQGPKDWLKQQFQRSEILKRCYGLYLSQAMKEVPIPEFAYDQSHIEAARQYFAGKNQLRHLEIIMEEMEQTQVPALFKPTEGKDITQKKIKGLLTQAEYQGDPEIVLRILEKRWFKEYWKPEGYLNQATPVNTTEGWQLYFGILKHMKATCSQYKIPMAVLCEVDEQSYEWSTNWYMSPNTEEARRNAMKPYQFIKEFGEKTGFKVIPQKRPYFRARNDPHPNAKGHYEMAMDIKDYLLQEFGDTLPKTASGQN